MFGHLIEEQALKKITKLVLIKSYLHAGSLYPQMKLLPLVKWSNLNGFYSLDDISPASLHLHLELPILCNKM